MRAPREGSPWNASCDAWTTAVAAPGPVDVAPAPLRPLPQACRQRRERDQQCEYDRTIDLISTQEQGDRHEREHDAGSQHALDPGDAACQEKAEIRAQDGA